ncbi:MAG: hypothetical protein IJU65_09325 [Desulfovibrio sp.]|nr:hypothetical protein [Desulfovibrio sp.]
MSIFSARDAETSLSCPQCGAKLHIRRTCHEVYMQCPACEARFPLARFIAQADLAMEHFLEGVYCDRI